MNPYEQSLRSNLNFESKLKYQLQYHFLDLSRIQTQFSGRHSKGKRTHRVNRLELHGGTGSNPTQIQAQLLKF